MRSATSRIYGSNGLFPPWVVIICLSWAGDGWSNPGQTSLAPFLVVIVGLVIGKEIFRLYRRVFQS